MYKEKSWTKTNINADKIKSFYPGMILELKSPGISGWFQRPISYRDRNATEMEQGCNSHYPGFIKRVKINRSNDNGPSLVRIIRCRSKQSASNCVTGHINYAFEPNVSLKLSPRMVSGWQIRDVVVYNISSLASSRTKKDGRGSTHASDKEDLVQRRG